MAELTDDASDLDLFREALNQVKTTNLTAQNPGTFADKIALLFQVESGSADFWNGLAIINQRLADLYEFYEQTTSSEIPPRTKAVLLKSILNFKDQFSIKSLNRQFASHQNYKCHVSENILDPLLGNITFLRQNRALIRLSDEETERCLNIIEEFIPEEGTPDGAIITLYESVNRLKFLVKNCRWFGHEPIIEELVALHFVASNLSEETADDEQSDSNPKKNTIAFVVTLANILLLPPSAIQGVVWYKETPAFKWVAEQIMGNRETLKLTQEPEPLKITHSPLKTRKEEEAEEPDGKPD